MSDIDRRRGKYVARWRDPEGKQHSKAFDRAGQLTLSEYAAGWLASLTTDPLTREGTETKWRVHILPALGDVPLAGLRPSTVRSFVAGLQRGNAIRMANLSAGYINEILSTLSVALGAAVEDKLIAVNPCASVKRLRVTQKRVTPWTPDQVAAVRAALPERYRALVDVAAGLGLRQGEAFGIQVGDVDFLRREVHIRRQVRIIGGSRLELAPPKGGKERTIPLPSTVGDALAAHLSVPSRALKSSSCSSTTNLIFTSASGGMINRNTFNKAWRAAVAAAGLPASRENGMHVLRHTFASYLLSEGGVDVRTCAEYMGHSDPGLTLRVYAHLMPSAPDKMRAAIDRAMSGELPRVSNEVVTN